MVSETIEHAGFSPVAAGTERPMLGVGLLGYGFMGKVHSSAYKRIPHVYWPPAAIPQLVAICGRTTDTVADVARRYGFAGYYTDWRAMLADERIQIFDNCASHALHVEPSIAAIAAGKHVICEKPLALSSADAWRMLSAARAAGVRHMCGFNYRFAPAIRLARDLVTGGALGRIYEFRCRYLQESDRDPDRPLRRRPDPASERAGTLANLGCHIIDLARFLIGEPSEVSARMSTVVRERAIVGGERVAIQSDDTFGALATFAGGIQGTLEGSRVATGRKNQLTFEINGSEGTLAFDLERLNELQIHLVNGATAGLAGFSDVLITDSRHPFVRVWWPGGHILGWEHAHVHELQHFIEAIALDKEIGPFGATFEDGYRAAVIAETIARAADTGRKLAIRYAED